MTSCATNDPGSLVAAADSGGFRLWPLFSAASLRRKLLDALACGGVSRRRRKRSQGSFRQPEQRTVDCRRRGSEKLSELLKVELSDSGSDEANAETKRKIEALDELQSAVRRLQQDEENISGGDRRREAAMEVRRLAKDDSDARETLALLGAIPPLVGMIDSGDVDLQIATLYALLNLGIGNDINKAAIVNAGAVHKMLNLIDSRNSNSALDEAIVANFLGLSALDSNKSVIGSSGAIPFLIRAFRNPNPNPSHSKQDALRALFNLSILPSNAAHLVESGIVPALISSISDVEVSNRVLSVLSNLVSGPEGRQAVARAADAIPALIDVLGWSDAPGCQESAAHVLMVVAHRARAGDRAAMVEAGIVSAMLELALMGSQLAQKRAARVLEILGVDKGKQVPEGFGFSGVSAVSAPIYSGKSAASSEATAKELDEEAEEEEEVGITEEKRAVRQLVQQSLQSNMRRIVRRANLPQDFSPSDQLKELTASSTSKSLPF